MRKARFPAIPTSTMRNGATEPGTGSKGCTGRPPGLTGAVHSEVSGGGRSGAPAPPWVSCRTRCAGARSPASSCASTLRSGEGGTGQEGGTPGNLGCCGSARGYCSGGWSLSAAVTQTLSSELQSRSVPDTASRSLHGLGHPVDPLEQVAESHELASLVGLIPGAPLCSLAAC